MALLLTAPSIPLAGRCSTAWSTGLDHSPAPDAASGAVPAESARLCVIGVDPDEVSNKKHKKAWKGLLEKQKNEPPFDYSHDGITISLQVKDCGTLSCCIRGCPSRDFGETHYTRGERNAQKHAEAMHGNLRGQSAADAAAAADPVLAAVRSSKATLTQMVLAAPKPSPSIVCRCPWPPLLSLAPPPAPLQHQERRVLLGSAPSLLLSPTSAPSSPFLTPAPLF